MKQNLTKFTEYRKKSGYHISVEKYTYGYEHIRVVSFGEGATLEIGKYCSIAVNTTIFLGGNHRHDWATTFPFAHQFPNDPRVNDIMGHPATNGDVIIGNDVWIGDSATIMSGITIGDGAVIAANSHVVKDVKPYEIVGGNPAGNIRFRFDQSVIDLLMTLQWWNLPNDTILDIASELSQPPSEEILRQVINKVTI